MKKIMLICNAGMSTGILAKKIQSASKGTMEVHAYAEAEYTDYLDGVDLILVSPQIRFLADDIEKKSRKLVKTIAPQKYGMMDGKGIFEDIKIELGV